MKLKKAKKIAKKLGFNFVEVDANLKIYAYDKLWGKYDNQWLCTCGDIKYIGMYTGSKHWTDTWREVKESIKKPISGQWQDIKTAPDDVSFYAAGNCGRYYLGSMLDGNFINNHGTRPYVEPLYWMPLPELPE